MKPYEVERFLETREIERNDRITDVLRGSMRPPDAAVITKLKEKRYGKVYGELPVLRPPNGGDSGKSTESRCDGGRKLQLHDGRKGKKKRKVKRNTKSPCR